jgi:hypothetical protein
MTKARDPRVEAMLILATGTADVQEAIKRFQAGREGRGREGRG